MGEVYIGSGDSRGPYRTADEFRDQRVGAAGDAAWQAHQDELRRNPLQDTEIVKAARRREEENRRRGGCTGYVW